MFVNTSRRIRRVIVPIGAGLLVLALSASVWALALRERANKRLYLEYEVYKAVTALTDIVRLQSLQNEDTQNVLGFGLYGGDGKPLTIYGKAPSSMPPLDQHTPNSRFILGKDSVILLRVLGGDLAGRRMMMGNDRMSRPRPSSPLNPLPLVPPYQDTANKTPALSYIELSTASYRAEESLLILTATIASMALLGLYVVILVMNRRYREAKDREIKDRELVELGEAARTIAHEIKNPLGVIRIQCGILRRGADEATVAGLSLIDDEAVRLAELADRIRRFLKSSDTKASEVPALRFIEEFVTRYSGVLGTTIDIAAGAVLMIDESRMVEALDNIVSNALDVSEQADEKPMLEARIRHRALVVSVFDRGPGMSQESKSRIFEPFYTTKARGTGLGLALARKTIETSGGAIRYADRPGGGAVFTVSLPLL
ncbi:hypothetical protein MASR2M48_01510 [Spirochaetota bacterium]